MASTPPAAAAPDELRPDATGVLVPVRYVAMHFSFNGGMGATCQLLQIGALAEPTPAEEAYAQAVRAVQAFLDTERQRWKTPCPARVEATKRMMDCHWLLKRFGEQATREMRGHSVWTEWAGRCITAQRNGAYVALDAIGLTHRGGALAPSERRVQFAALLDALVATREAAYPREWVRALEPLFRTH